MDKSAFGLLLCTAMAPTMAHAQAAQSTDPQSSTASATATAGQQSMTPSAADSSPAVPSIGDIVVTATRRAQSSERVPISLVAIGSDELERRSIRSIVDIASATPGLTFQQNGFSATLTIISFRGLESLFGASTVGVYLDDTPIQGRLSAAGNIGNPYPAVFDLKQVEIARGPQGTLFGAGSETGTLRFITNEPSLTEYSGRVHADLGFTEKGGVSHEIGAAVGGPIVEDKLGFRASVWERTNGGYVGQITPYNQQMVATNANVDKTIAARFALTAEPIEGLKITPSVFYQDITGHDNGRFDPNFSDPGRGEFNSSRLLREFWKDRVVVPSVKIESDLPFAELTAVASYLHRKADLRNDLGGLLGAIGLVDYGNPLGRSYPGSAADVSPFTTGLVTDGYTQEVRLASNHPDAFASWVVGVFHDQRTQTDYQLQFSQRLDPTGKEVFFTQQRVSDKQIAAFAQVDIRLMRRLTLTVGDRQAWTKVDQTNVNGTGSLDATPAFASTHLKENPNTPHASLNFQADSHNLFYATYSQGFRVGGGNNPLPSVCGYSGVPATYTSDRVTNYEIGAKNLLFGGRLRLDTSVFHIDWSKIQQLAQPACGISYTFNAGNAVSNGFDLAAEAAVTDRLRLNASVGYANAHLTADVFDANGIILAQHGDRIGYLPFVNSPWNIVTSATYTVPIGPTKTDFRVEYRHNSRNPGPFINQIINSPNYAPQVRQDPETDLVNVSATARINKIELSVYINNLLNAHPLLGKYGQAILSAPTYSTFRPRTIGLMSTVAF